MTDAEKVALLQEHFELDEDTARAAAVFIAVELAEYKRTGDRSAAKLAARSAAEKC